MNNFIEYIGIRSFPKNKIKFNHINYFFEKTLELGEDFNNAEITKVYLNSSTEMIKNIDVKSTSFCTIKIDISLEYLDESKFGIMLSKKITFYKSFFIKNSMGYILKLDNLIANAKLLKITNQRYYIFLNIYSIEEE
ncbi:MAG: hypothetical protein ACRCTZ_03435 [Sarcina sp.]